MQKHLMVRLLAVGILLTMVACSNTSSASTSSDSANPATAGSNVAGTAAPSAPAPVPAPPPPVVIRGGTALTVTIDETVSTKTNNTGDSFEASLAEPVTVAGDVVLPAGAKCIGTVTEADSAGRVKGGSVLAITLDSVTVHGKKYSVQTSSYQQAGKGQGKRTAVGAGGGAAFGAIVSAIAGGSKGAAIRARGKGAGAGNHRSC